MTRKFLVIGIGRFGRSVLKELHQLGYTVVGCDLEPKTLEEIDDFCTYVVEGDSTDDHLLEELNVLEFDSIIVSIGDNFEACALTVTKLSELGCKNIIAKANNHTKGGIISRCGANQIIYPEEESGFRLARQQAYPGMREFIEINQHFSGIEMEVPDEFVGKSLSELQFRRKYEATVLVISRKTEQDAIISPGADEVLEKGDFIVVVGDKKDLKKLQKPLSKKPF